VTNAEASISSIAPSVPLSEGSPQLKRGVGVSNQFYVSTFPIHWGSPVSAASGLLHENEGRC
jgi:hypothetical protein